MAKAGAASATKQPQAQDEVPTGAGPQPGTEIVDPAVNWAADAGAGIEGADKDSFAIPFLIVLQANSPAVEAVPNAKAGMLMDTVSNRLFTEAIIIPCAFQRRHIRWGAREAGGGFKGEFTTAQVNELRKSNAVKELDGRLYFPEQDGSINPKKSDRLADTRQHYVLLVDGLAADFGTPIVFALTSTGIKVSKQFLSRVQSIQLKHEGRVITAPSFSHGYRVTTSKKTNEKGTWWQPSVEMLGPVNAPALYAMGRAFHKQVMEGSVQAAHDTLHDDDNPGGGGGEGDQPGKF